MQKQKLRLSRCFNLNVIVDSVIQIYMYGFYPCMIFGIHGRDTHYCGHDTHIQGFQIVSTDFGTVQLITD